MLGRLVALRYRLLWARARGGKGRLVVRFVGAAMAAMMAVFLALGGFSAGVSAVHAGRGEQVAGAVLFAFYLVTIGASVLLGPSLNAVFTDAGLRRYPMSPAERWVARHLIALLDPLWLFALALDLGIAAGFSMAGAAPAGLAVASALVLLATNYLAARAAIRLVEIAMTSRAGRVFAMIAGTILLAAAPAISAASGRNPARLHFLAPLKHALAVTPPFEAAAALSRSSSGGSTGALAALALWGVSLVLILVFLERLQIDRRPSSARSARWTTMYDRVAAMAGPTLAPFVAKTLRYIVRSPQVRFNFPVALPLIALVVWQAGGRGTPDASFLATLGAVASIGAIATGALSLNLFGFDGQGACRYFLLPVAPAVVLRAISFGVLAPGAVLIALVVLAWTAFSPGEAHALRILMLLSSGVAGLLFYQALGVWTSVLSPRLVPFTATVGQRLPLPAALVLAASILGLFGAPALLERIGASTVIRHWWIAPLTGLGAAAFYSATLRGAGAVFAGRGERLIATLDGRR